MIPRGGLFTVALMACAGVARSQQPDQPPPARQQLEGDIRRYFAQVVRQRVGLSDEQMRQLGPVTQRIEQQRRGLQQDERAARVALQAQMRDAAPDQGKITEQLDRLLDIQRRRVTLLEQEQKDLAGIMTPLQRARYMALQEQVRRRLEQMRQRRMMGADAPPPRRGPPPPDELQPAPQTLKLH